MASHAVLTPAETARAYVDWERDVADDAAAFAPWHVPLRRAMWLWSMTWCAKWRALSDHAAKIAGDGEDWSREHSDDALVRHVRDRVDHYLAPDTAERLAAEIEALDDLIAAERRRG